MRLLPRNSAGGWTAYGWLIYSIPFAVSPAFRNASVQDWLLNSAGMVAFLALYFWAHWLPGRRILWAVIGLTLLGMVYTPWNPNAVSFFIYAAVFIGWTGEAAVVYPCLALLLTIFGLQAFLFQFHSAVTITGLTFSALVANVMMYYAQRSRSNRKLRLAQEEIEQLAKVAERERIARDLHDVLGHTLSVIVLKSELAARLSGADPQRAAMEIHEVEIIAREALTQVRAAVQGYRAAGLAREFDNAQELLRDCGMEVRTTYRPGILTSVQETVLSLALREAITNVIRHSSARLCELRLENIGPFLELEVVDDGVGGEDPEGAGLTGMRERIQSLGGSVQRDGRRGTMLLIRVPCSQAA